MLVAAVPVEMPRSPPDEMRKVELGWFVSPPVFIFGVRQRSISSIIPTSGSCCLNLESAAFTPCIFATPAEHRWMPRCLIFGVRSSTDAVNWVGVQRPMSGVRFPSFMGAQHDCDSSGVRDLDCGHLAKASRLNFFMVLSIHLQVHCSQGWLWTWMN